MTDGASGTALATRADAALEHARMTGRVVESLVIRGDISALSPEERARFYVQMCEALGLNPRAQPFALLKLNGKEVLYPTRGATDQLAAIHRLTREIVDGPKVIDLAGTKMAYAVCRATHPNGRVETAVATVPLSDPLNALMKCETKAKRRATLSILGLGMLDEAELETIPEHLKGAGPPIELPAEPPQLEAPDALTLDALRDRLRTVPTAQACVALWIETRDRLASADRTPGGEACARRWNELAPAQAQDPRPAFKRAVEGELKRRADGDAAPPDKRAPTPKRAGAATLERRVPDATEGEPRAQDFVDALRRAESLEQLAEVGGRIGRALAAGGLTEAQAATLRALEAQMVATFAALGVDVPEQDA